MPGTYVVNYSDPSKTPIQIPPLGADGSTSMRMVGYRAPVYGEMLWENFLHLLEQFAGVTPPANPTEGQIWANTTTTPARLYFYDSRVSTNIEYPKWHLIDTAQIQYTTTPPSNGSLLWYDSAASTLRYFDGDSWDAMTAISGATAPVNPYNSQLWHDTTTSTLRYWNGTNWAAMTAISAGSPPSNPNPGDLWHDTDVNTLRYWDGSTWDPLTNIAAATPPANPYNGQLWLNTSTTPPEMFYRDSSTTTIGSLPGWHRTSAGIHIGSTAPAWNEGAWYNPATGALNLYVSGNWTNILTTTFAGTCDYNAIVTDVNVLLERVGEPTLSAVSGVVTSAQWNALFDTVRYLATFRNIPYPKPSAIKNLPSTAGIYSSDSACGIYSLRRRLRIVEQALCSVGGSNAVNPICFEEQPTAQTATLSTPWNSYIHTSTATFASATALEEFFGLGGYLTWTGSINAPENPVNDAWESLMVALSGVNIRSATSSFAGQTSPVGALDLGSTEVLIALVSSTTRDTATAEIYGSRSGAVVTLRLVLTEHVSSVGVTGSLLSSFGSVRVGAPCKPTPQSFPTLSGSGAGSLPAPTYSIVPDVVSVSEGGTVTFTVATTNVPAGTVLKWLTGVVGSAVTQSDFADNTFSGTVTIGSGGTGTITRQIATDATVESAEEFRLILQEDGPPNPAAIDLATSAWVSVVDVAPPATYSIASTATNVAEGGTATFNVTTTNVPNGTVLKWFVETGSGATGADFVGTVAGTVTVVGGSGAIPIGIATDDLDDDGETFRVALYPQSSSGTNPSEQLAISNTVTIGNIRAITVNSYTSVSTGVAGGSGPPPPAGHVPTNAITVAEASGASTNRIWFNITVSGVTASQANPLTISGKVSSTSPVLSQILVVSSDGNSTPPVTYVTTNGTYWVAALNYLTASAPAATTPVPGTYPWTIEFEGVVYDTFDLVITA